MLSVSVVFTIRVGTGGHGTDDVRRHGEVGAEGGLVQHDVVAQALGALLVVGLVVHNDGDVVTSRLGGN